jgi:hypothetical protein
MPAIPELENNGLASNHRSAGEVDDDVSHPVSALAKLSAVSTAVDSEATVTLPELDASLEVDVSLDVRPSDEFVSPWEFVEADAAKSLVTIPLLSVVSLGPASLKLADVSSVSTDASLRVARVASEDSPASDKGGSKLREASSLHPIDPA